MENYIRVTELAGSEVFHTTVQRLEQTFHFLQPDITQDFTGAAFVELYKNSRALYQAHFPEMMADYVPIYVSMWKLSAHEMVDLKNMHQDGGIHYFAKNGYQARMKTLWTNLYKSEQSDTASEEMGIYVVDCENPDHHALYQQLAKHNTHFFQRSDYQLCDMRQLGDISVDYDLTSLEQTAFPYKVGTSIQFNSRMLHGSKALKQEGDPDRFRVALTSVWLHKDDLDESVVQKPDLQDEELFLAACEPSLWPALLQEKKPICDREKMRLRLIRDLIATHRELM